jgi:serine phosphatase RsbU (regulator of sigma subunit)
MEPFHQAMVKGIDRLLAQGATPDPAVTRATADVMLANEPSFLSLMDKITFLFDKEAKERISSMQLLEKIILAVGLSILLFEFLFVFRPSLSQLATMMTSLKATGAELKESNTRLQESLDQLNISSRQLAESNRKVMDSITYARRIQTSMLPDAALLDRHLKEWFVIYRQRDTVGGDFYYFRALRDAYLVAVIDCSGHGVPGALMTMTVHALLKNIPDPLCTVDMAGTLGELNRLVREALPHDSSGHAVDIGLDIGICYCRPAERWAVFSGAGISLYVAMDGDIVEIPGERRLLGHRRSRSGATQTNHELVLEDGARLYLCTDGFFDQEGGDRGFGFGRERFTAMLVNASLLSMRAQKDHFQQVLDDYRGPAPQRDDIVLLGLQT